MGAFATVRHFADSDSTGLAERQEEEKKPQPRSASEVVGDIAGYIPAEGLTAYLTAYALVANAKDGGPEVAAWASLAVGAIAVLFFGIFSVSSVAKDKKVDRRNAAFGAALAVALFVLYVTLVPENPFAQLEGWISWVTPLVAVVVTVALGLWGDKIKLPKQKAS